MTRHLFWPVLICGTLAGLGCNKDKSDYDTGSIGGDEGGDGSTGDSAADGDDGSADSGDTWTCAGTYLDSEPEDEDTGVYWRDQLELEFEGDGSDAIITLEADGSATDISADFTFEDGGLTASYTPSPALAPSTAYTLTVQCADTVSVGFTTSAYGESMTAEAADLVGNTYYFDLPGASFKQPTGVGALMGLFLDAPILIGITAESDNTLTVLGAQGQENEVGTVSQDTGQSTWDFGEADFSTSPFFEADAPEIVITYAYGGTDLPIPVTDFHIEGTFNADGTVIGGGKAWGLGDTRNLGPAVAGEEGDSVVCDYLGGFGLECATCNDGGDYCLFIEAWFDDADLLDGLVLETL